MGNSLVGPQRAQASFAFDPSCERGGAEVERPNAVIDFVEGDGFAGQCLAQKQGLRAPGHGPGGARAARTQCRGYTSGGRRPGSGRVEG